mgnify:CR=1 FL=1
MANYPHENEDGACLVGVVGGCCRRPGVGDGGPGANAGDVARFDAEAPLGEVDAADAPVAKDPDSAN